jgi:hypothetical protein
MMIKDVPPITIAEASVVEKPKIFATRIGTNAKIHKYYNK